MKTAIQIVLVAAIIVLAYMLYESIQNPIRFNKDKAIREEGIKCVFSGDGGA